MKTVIWIHESSVKEFEDTVKETNETSNFIVKESQKIKATKIGIKEERHYYSIDYEKSSVLFSLGVKMGLKFKCKNL